MKKKEIQPWKITNEKKLVVQLEEGRRRRGKETVRAKMLRCYNIAEQNNILAAKYWKLHKRSSW